MRHEHGRSLGHDVVSDAGQHDQLRVGHPVREHEPGAQGRDHVVRAPHDQGRRADGRQQRPEVLQDQPERGDPLRLAAQELLAQGRQLQHQIGRGIEEVRGVGEQLGRLAQEIGHARQHQARRIGHPPQVMAEPGVAVQDPRRVDHHQAAHLLGIASGVEERDGAAHGMAHQVDRART